MLQWILVYQFPLAPLTYAHAIYIGLFVIGTATLIAAATCHIRGKTPEPFVGNLIWLSCVWIVAYAVFLFVFVLADGGLVAGVWQTATATLPLYGTESSLAGLVGYRVGQAIGVALWALYIPPLVLLNPDLITHFPSMVAENEHGPFDQAG